MAPCFVLEVQRFKISGEIWKNSKSRRIVAFTEGLYKTKVIKSADSKLYNGSKYILPWNDHLQKVQVNFFFIDDLLTVDIGTALYVVSEDGNFHTDGTPTDVVLKIYPMGGTVAVGKVMVSVSVQPMFDDEQLVQTVQKKPVLDHNFAVPGFRFKRLSRVLHWERIRSLNISQTVQNGDVHTLLTCLDDVTTGDVSQEDVDPQLYKALQLAQYSSQYLLSSRKVMKEKETVLKMALKTFQEEEELLDLKLAKLRARDKALKREARDLDDLTVEYSSALREVNPKLVNRLYKTYQDKLRQPSPDELARLAEADLRNWEADERSWSPREETQRRRGAGRRGHSQAGHHHREHRGQHSPDRYSEDYGGDSAPEAKESWRTGSVEDLHPQRRDNERTAPADRHQGQDDHYTWSRGSSHSKPQASLDKSAWATGRDTRDAAHDEGRNSKAPSDQLRGPVVQPPQQAGWKTTMEVSHKPGATAVPRSDHLDNITSSILKDNPAEESDYDSGVERSRIESSSANLKRLASRSEFVKAASPPPQPMIRTLSMRSVAVSSDVSAGDSGKFSATQPSVPVTPSGAAAVEKTPSAGSTPPLRKPAVSSSVELSDKAWGTVGTSEPHSSRAVPAVQQSTGELSVATAMSVDSLNEPSARATAVAAPVPAPAPAAFQRNPVERTSINDLANNSESYEAVDLSSFIQASRLNDTNRSFGSTEYGNDVGISERILSADVDRSAERQLIAPQGSDDPDASLMMEEFDDSVHMDHHPVPAHAARTAHPSIVTATGVHQAVLPPLSASKQTPKRDYTFQDHQDPHDRDGHRDHNSSEEYSVGGDSPFPNLSGGKDYNRLMRQNNSHISSNNSSSRNLSNLPQNNSNSNLLNRSATSQNSTNASASYEFDTFEDEDDPFARGPGPRKTIEFSNISGASSDVDASKSIMIDFMLPSESKEPQRGTGGLADSKYSQQSSRASSRAEDKPQFHQRDQSYDEKDTSGEIGMFSPLARPRSSGRLGRSNDDDDVLMGTTKISLGNTSNYARTGPGSAGLGSTGLGNTGMGSRNSSTGQFERDSLSGTGNSNARQASSFSPQVDHSDRDETAETEDESIPPPTYDSIIGGGTGGTEDSYLRTSQASQSHDASSYFETSADASAAYAAPHIHAVEPAAGGVDGPVWQLGRAPVDAVELAHAVDVFVSAVRLDAQHARIYSEIQIKVEFLGVMSELSGVVDIGRTESVQPVSFSAHLIFTAEQEQLLQEEISQQDDAICCYVHVVDAITQEIVGSASVELWIMIEDAVNILRQEVEVLNLDMSHEMGSAVVDVKGFRLLKKCAAALRSRRNS